MQSLKRRLAQPTERCLWSRKLSVKNMSWKAVGGHASYVSNPMVVGHIGHILQQVLIHAIGWRVMYAEFE